MYIYALSFMATYIDHKSNKLNNLLHKQISSMNLQMLNWWFTYAFIWTIRYFNETRHCHYDN